MKTHPSIVATLAALAFMTIVGLLQLDSQGQTTAVLPSTASELPPVQYRVLDIGQLTVMKEMTPSQTLELILNENAAQGWRVASTTGSFVIFIR